MPKCLKEYVDKRKAKRYRDRHRMLNYELGNFSNRMHEPYDFNEQAEILDHSIPDRELAKKLERSVKAIQIKRCQLKKTLPGFPLKDYPLIWIA